MSTEDALYIDVNRKSVSLDGLTELESAILKTVAYVDLFDYPLTFEELHRYLVGVAVSAETLHRALQSEALLSQHLLYRRPFYALQGREEVTAIRQQRAAAAEQLWPAAWRYGRIISRLPFVRMVAVTGSLAVNNADRNADIDYLIVTEPGRLWLCRAMVILVVRLAARRGVPLCPNYFLSEKALAFSEQNLYAARELAQMVPVSGLEVYHKMRRENQWMLHYLPNAAAAPSLPEGQLPVEERRPGQRILEGMMRLPPMGRLEKWEMGRKIRKFSRQDQQDEAAFSADWCKGHFSNHAQQVLTGFDRQWKTLKEENR